MSSDDATLVRAGFEAFLQGDFDALRDLLEPDAQWLWYEPTPGDCLDRDQILETLRCRHREGVVAGLNDVVEGAGKVLVEVIGPRLRQRGLPDGQACMVVTVRDGRIVRMQDHASRADALADAGLAPKPVPEPPAPLEHSEPGWDRVSGLIPFVHVADLQASLAFYAQLGFRVAESYPSGPPGPSWAALEAGDARLMLQHSDRPVRAASQRVLFYLYARDLFGLRERLVAAGVEAGEIVDGRPGPREEMRVEDPDGYVLMIARIDDEG